MVATKKTEGKGAASKGSVKVVSKGTAMKAALMPGCCTGAPKLVR